MRFVFSVLLLLFFGGSVICQSTWNKLYNGGFRSETVTRMFVHPDGDIYLGAKRFDSIFNDVIFPKLTIYQVDSDEGIELNEWSIDGLLEGTFDWQINDFHLMNNGDWLLSVLYHRVDDPINGAPLYYDGGVMNLSLEFDQIWSYFEIGRMILSSEYHFSLTTFLEGDSIVLFGNGVTSDNLTDEFCFYFDDQGIYLGSEKINLTALNSRGSYTIASILEQDEGYLCFISGGNPTLLTSRVFLVRLDKQKQIVWSYEYPEEYDYFSIPQRDGLKRAVNGDYAWVYKKQFMNSSTRHPAFFVHDSNFVERWRYVVEDLLFSFQTVAACANGDYVVVGNDFTYERGDSTTFMPIFRRFSADGELLWERAVLPPEGITPRTPARILHLKELPDGRILGVGDAFERQPDGRQLQSTWAFALNANGCFTDDCTSENIITSTQEVGTLIDFSKGGEIALFPNPAVEEVHLAYGLLANETTPIKWSDAVGRTLAETTVRWDAAGKATVTIPKTENRHFVLQIQLPDGSVAGLKVERER